MMGDESGKSTQQDGYVTGVGRHSEKAIDSFSLSIGL